MGLTDGRPYSPSDLLFEPGTGPQFFSFPRDVNTNKGVFYGPRIAGPGMPIVHDIKVVKDNWKYPDNAKQSPIFIPLSELTDGRIAVTADFPPVGKSSLTLAVGLMGGNRGHLFMLESEDGVGRVTVIEMQGLI
jgi:hypothetical protein